ncbi:MAG: flavodoxin domain-containing protein [Nitriliruptorales bacterium]|nr:flavodoxin domain-containing protein [Nitriliruptorales bacterium]
MRVLVAYASKMGGTAELAEWLGDALREEGFDVDVRDAEDVVGLVGYRAVVLGSALYVFRWHRNARRFVRRHRRELEERPLWLFSSGPLDDSATEGDVPPVRDVRRAMERIAVIDHATFGGRLPADASGFPARAMAKESAGDWRDPEQVREWAREIAAHLHAMEAWSSPALR